MKNREFMCLAPPEVPIVYFKDWLRSQSVDDQHQFRQAQTQEQNRRVLAIKEKKLKIIDPPDQSPLIFIFSNEADKNQFMENVNPTWLSFWERYSNETGTFIDIDIRIV